MALILGMNLMLPENIVPQNLDKITKYKQYCAQILRRSSTFLFFLFSTVDSEYGYLKQYGMKIRMDLGINKIICTIPPMVFSLWRWFDGILSQGTSQRSMWTSKSSSCWHYTRKKKKKHGKCLKIQLPSFIISE